MLYAIFGDPRGIILELNTRRTERTLVNIPTAETRATEVITTVAV